MRPKSAFLKVIAINGMMRPAPFKNSSKCSSQFALCLNLKNTFSTSCALISGFYCHLRYYRAFVGLL